MAGILGSMLYGFESGDANPSISSDLNGYTPVEHNPAVYDSPDNWFIHGGYGKFRGAASTRWRVLGGHMGTFFDDFYNRIHVRPKLIDFGSITPPQTRTVDLWNAFIVPKTLAAITTTDDASGLSFAPAPPETLKALQELTLTLTADQDVSPNVDVTFTLEWSGLPDITIRVTGISVIAVPWKQAVGMQESLAWLTDVLTAKDGSEQAISLREVPRQTYAVTLLPADYAGAQHAFVSGYGRRFAVPSIDDGQPFTVAAGATQVLLDTTRGDWRDMVMLWVDEYDFEIIEVDSTEPDRLILKRPTGAARTGRAYPTGAARLISPPTRTTYARPGGSITATFEFVSGSNLAADPSPVQWEGIDVLLVPPKLHPVEDSMQQRIETLDNRTGWPVDDRFWPHAKVARPMRWVVDREEMWTLRRWLHRRRGQWRPFWHPSFEPDFTIAGTGFINNLLVVKPNGFERYGVLKPIALRTLAGTWVFANVTGITTSGDNVGLQLSPNLGTLPHEQITRVSLMGLKRLADDEVLINHLGGGIHEVLADFLEY